MTNLKRSNKSIAIWLVVVAIALTACGGNGGTGYPSADTPNGVSTVNGAVQKGPFIVGTPVYVNELDALGNASESTTLTDIKDSVGSFTFKVNGPGPVQIVSTGYYFNELTGQISSGTLTLKAIYEVSDKNEQTAYVNILTHLINDRILNLIRDGTVTLHDAIIQAQSELIKALNPVLPTDKLPDFNALSVYNINPDNQVGNSYLLALSTAFYRYAQIKAQGQNTSADAQLALILNQIAKDFSDDGLIQTSGFTDDLTNALRELNPIVISDNLRQRSSIDYSTPLDIPDITMFFGLCAGAADCMWSSAAPMPVPTRSHASAVYNNKIYIFGGANPNDYADDYAMKPVSTAYTGVYEYDPDANEWSQKKEMPVGMYVLSAHTVGDKIYIIGGYGVKGFDNSVLEYDPVSDSWAQKTPMPTYRYAFMSEEVNGKIYVIGGQGTIDDGPSVSGKPWENKNHVEIYDPAIDSWTNGNSAPLAISNAASCAIDNEIYILGGETGNSGSVASDTTISSNYVYNTITDSWTTRSSAGMARARHTCVRVGNEFYVMGGYNTSLGSAASDQVEVYSTDLDSWKGISYLPTARMMFSADPIDAKIFMFGGESDFDTILNSVEVLDTSMIH